MALLNTTRRTASSSLAFLSRLLSRSLNPAASSVAQLSSRSFRYKSDGESGDESDPTDCLIIAEGGTYGTRSNKIDIRHGFCDSYMQNPFQTAGPKGAYEVKQVEEGLFLRMEIPGIDKEDVKIWVEDDDTVYVKGEGKNGSVHDKCGRTYNAKIKVPTDDVEIEEMEAEIKNGVLQMLFPKSKPYQGNYSDARFEIKLK